MPRYALGLEYDGQAFLGWQRQAIGPTVQACLEDALSRIAAHPVAATCAGRTDTGVHACGQVVHFDSDARRPDSAWVRGVNALLPSSIAVRWARPVPDDFHARYAAIGRSYRYLLLNRPQRPGLGHGRFGWHHRPLDLAAMQAAAGQLLGEHDFSAFRAAECQARSPIKLMRHARVRQQGTLFIFDFEATAFLHHMVRNLVGSLVHIGKGSAPPAWIAELLQQKDRRLAAPTFAAAGLYFRGPEYESHWQLPPLADGPELPLF